MKNVQIPKKLQSQKTYFKMQSLQLPAKHKIQFLDRSPSIDKDKRFTDSDTHNNNDMFNCDPLKLLVHNVSHADLCLTIQPDNIIGINKERELMARPRSSRYRVMLIY